jgi:gentisate 1,2-dioxygenase
MTDLSGGQISLEDYKAELERLSVNLAAMVDQPLIMPKAHQVVPHHWRWGDLERVLHQSLQFQDKLPTGRAGAERRIVRLQNPGLDGETVTNTMSMSVQLLLPGEIARPHRHTPVAFRFFLKGNAYTTVHGEKHEMRPGDLVLTPYMCWHDHGNDGSEPGIWIDGLDFPLVRFLDAVIKQDTDTPQQSTNRSGTSERRFGATGLRPVWVGRDEVERSSLIHYRWDETEAALNAMADADDASPTDDIMFEYVNPATGESVFATIACYIQMIRPGIRTARQRETAHKVYHAFRGSGQTVVEDQTFEWSQGDFFVIPSLAWHQHNNSHDDPAILFSLQDGPTLKRLGLYRHETADTGQ